MEFRAKQISPPKSWEHFEDLCHALFKKVWKDPLAQKEGRRGQPQNGVDIFGSINEDRSRFYGVQCKGKDANYGASASWSEILIEIAKADSFSPQLEHWIYATTAPVDGKLQREARVLSNNRATNGKFTISVLGWEEIQALIAQEPSVVQEFYPEAAFNLPQILHELKNLIGLNSFRNSDDEQNTLLFHNVYDIWQKVSFHECIERDLGPALMGRSLGPNDATICPKLREVDILVNHLQMAFNARLLGIPGAGKSICAYQVALYFSKKGYSVNRLITHKSASISFKQDNSDKPTLFLIDDAHLIPPPILRDLEDLTNSKTLLLSIHNTINNQDTLRGAVLLNHERAIKTIAQELRHDYLNTLNAVRRADNHVGEGMMDINLNHRIDEAESNSTYPWQFCFILGGGWRRAKHMANTANAAKFDLVLALIAIRQIISRDETLQKIDCILLCQNYGISQSVTEETLSWLTKERFILSPQDCRTPHQRFSAVILQEILINQNNQNRKKLFLLIEDMLSNPIYPLFGIRNLLHEIRFNNSKYLWNLKYPFKTSTVHKLASRCWQIGSCNDDEKNASCYVLDELIHFIDNGLKVLIEPNKEFLATWITTPNKAANGLGWLLNSIRNSDKSLHKAIVNIISPEKLAVQLSNITTDSAYGIAHLLRSVHCYELTDWNLRFRNSINQDKLDLIATEWVEFDQAFLLCCTCVTIFRYDEALALNILEKYIPVAKQIFHINPIEGFRQLQDVFMIILHIFDPLGVFGKPDVRRKNIGKKMCVDMSAELLARHISQIQLRQFQETTFFLDFLYKCAPKKFAQVIQKLDWVQINSTIGDHWNDLPHEIEIFIGVLYIEKKGRSMVTNFITQHSQKIIKFPPRLALLVPQIAIQHVISGREIRLTNYGNVDWDFGAIVIELFAEECPDKLFSLLHIHEEKIAKVLSAQNSSWFSHADEFLESLSVHSPDTLKSILIKIDINTASDGWIDSLKKGGKARKAVAILIDSAIDLPTEVGQLAKKLRQRFPSKSTTNIKLR